MFLKSVTSSGVRVALLTGHSIVVPPEGREVPENFVSECLKTGQVTAVEPPSQPVSKKETTDAGKIERIKDAIKTALEAGDKSFLTAAGVPDARKLDKLVGEQVSVAERDQAWAELQAEAGE